MAGFWGIPHSQNVIHGSGGALTVEQYGVTSFDSFEQEYWQGKHVAGVHVNAQVFPVLVVLVVGRRWHGNIYCGPMARYNRVAIIHNVGSPLNIALPPLSHHWYLGRNPFRNFFSSWQFFVHPVSKSKSLQYNKSTHLCISICIMTVSQWPFLCLFSLTQL